MKLNSRRRIAVLLTILCATVVSTDPNAQEPSGAGGTISIDVRPQPLREALTEFGKQTGLHVVMYSVIAGRSLKERLTGRFTPETALDKLLANANLRYEFLDARTVAIFEAEQPRHGSAERDARQLQTPRPPGGSASSAEAIGEMTVTGTHIRGVQHPSPVIAITPDEMRQSGDNTLGEAIRTVVQNFIGGQNPSVALGAQQGIGNEFNINLSGASTLNLRGLGADATLTLLNGKRMPYGGLTQATDVSVIPIAAIDRLEILLDGASAIYGSDAIGGVANIILKRDFDGVELSARYGRSTDGGYEQQQFAGIAGTTWDTGGFFVNADIAHNAALLAGERDYLSNVPSPDATVYPKISQQSVVFSAHQALGGRAEATIEAFYTHRDQTQLLAITNILIPSDHDATIWGVGPAVSLSLPREWSLTLNAVSGENEVKINQENIDASTGAQLSQAGPALINKLEAANLQLEGPLFNLAGGQARISFGAGYRKNEFENRERLGSALSFGGEDASRYAYIEAGLPVLDRLYFNGAVRHEDYDSFGGTTTPKVGAVWNVMPGLDLKASWGESFKVPRFSQLFASQSVDLYSSTRFQGMPAGQTVLGIFGGNPALGPERATVITAGFTARPSFLQGFSFELSGFDIDYRDRVVQPVNPFEQALTNPAFADFVTPQPTPAQLIAVFTEAGLPIGELTDNFAGVPYDPANVALLVRNMNANSSEQHTRGVDLIAHYSADALGGRLSMRGNATWMDSTRKLTSRAPEIPVSGAIFYPAEIKASLGASWSRDGLTVSPTLRYIDGVTDTNVMPNLARGSMTTLDVVIDYRMALPRIGDLGLNLAIVNALDEDPPFTQPLALQPWVFAFDSTKYTALGRVISFTVTKPF